MRATRFLLSVLNFTLCLAPFAHAQITNVTADQTPPLPGVGHDYQRFLNETVNPVTGSVRIRISVPVPSGRGITVPFAFSHDSNSAHHRVSNLSFWDNQGYVARGGWTYLVPQLDRIRSVSRNQVTRSYKEWIREIGVRAGSEVHLTASLDKQK